MSVEALTWAFRQRGVPPKVKVVLLALADQADELTGLVCYGKVNVAYLSEKAAVSRATFFRYVAGLIRNGYMRRDSGKVKGEANQFWLCLDRKADIGLEWIWGKPDDADPQDIGEGVSTGDTPAAHEIETPPNAESETPGVSLAETHNTSSTSIHLRGDEQRKAKVSGREAPPIAAPKGDGWFSRASKEATAVKVLCQIVGQEHYFYDVMGGQQTILYKGEITPALMALVAAPPRKDWVTITDAQVAAWFRFTQHYLPGRRVRLTSPARAPWSWPPRRDGSLYDRPPDALADEDSAELKAG